MVTADDMDLAAVQRKKADVERQLKEIEHRRVELEAWLRDLVVTERTLARILDVDLPDNSQAAPQEAAPHRRRKPENTPSIFDMARIIIRDRGDEWVEGAEIVAGIRRRWWPDAESNDITPTLWRLATKDSRLRKEGTRYAMPIVDRPEKLSPQHEGAPQ